MELEDIDPPIWRRLLVPGSIRLSKLSDVLQVAMGWTNSHLHSFTVGDDHYGMHVEDWPDNEVDEKTVTVLQALHGHDRFLYEYDFGDGWTHDVSVEREVDTGRALKFAVCLAGESACPPEDCGGPSGYEQLLETLADPRHEDHEELLDWLGGPFDAAAFDLAAVNAELQRLR